MRYLVTLIALSLFIGGCTGGGDTDGSDNGNGQTMDVDESKIKTKRAGVNKVLVYEGANPQKLNPIVSTSANSSNIERFIYMGMIDIIPNNPFTYVPHLAVERPTMEKTTEGGAEWAITYQIRPEAVWDDGTPVTARDFDFSLKIIKNPSVDAESLRAYLDFILGIKLYEDDPKKITYLTKTYFMQEIWTGSLSSYPEHIYDPKQVHRKYTVAHMTDPANTAALKADRNLADWAADFNSDKYGRDPETTVGCGPYKLKEFVTDQYVIIEKKKDWWGDELAKEIPGMENFVDEVRYEIIKDQTTAVTVLKDEGLDVMRDIKPKAFAKDLPENKRFMELYTLSSPPALRYNYIGMNMKNPKLSDKRVRQALSHLLDYDYLVDIVYYGLATRINGPLHPSKPYYNNELPLRDFNIEKAKTLLEEAGWVDSDGDGVRDRVIDGKKTDLRIDLFRTTSEVSESVSAKFREASEKAGIVIEPVIKEWTVMIEQTKSHDFEMFLGGWVAAPTLPDMRQIWHSSSTDRGSNYTYFGTPESDDLLEKIPYEMDEEKRHEMYMRVQEIIYDEAPYIFMYSTNARVAIHKRFDAEAHTKRPNYYEGSFMLKPSFGAVPLAGN